MTSLVPSGEVASTWMSVNYFRHAVHHLRACEHTCAPDSQIGNTSAIARTFQDEIGDKRDGFRVIELDPPIEPAARDHGGGGDQELVFFPRRGCTPASI